MRGQSNAKPAVPIWNTETDRAALAYFSQFAEQDETQVAPLMQQLQLDQPQLHARLRTMLAARDLPSSIALASVDSQLQMPVPSSIGSFQIKSEIGRGGMGVVLRGERQLGDSTQLVAIKLMPQMLVDQQAHSRFALEREILSKLEHPHIARLIDGGESSCSAERDRTINKSSCSAQRDRTINKSSSSAERDRTINKSSCSAERDRTVNAPEHGAWYAMELVQGLCITEFAKLSTCTLAQRLALLIDLCDAVHFAHQHLILHRDIKPSNVLVTQDGQLKLIDFGIAKSMATHNRLTVESAPMTPRFAAPEQRQGQPASIASEVWQIGLLAYELLTGILPSADQDPQAQQRLASDQVIDTSALGVAATTHHYRQQLRGNIDAILRKTLQLEPQDRYLSVAALAEDLRASLHDPHSKIQARRHERWYRSRTWVRKHRWASAFAALAALSLIAATVLIWTYAQRANQESLNAQAMNRVLLDIFLTNDLSQSQESTSLRSFYEAGIERLLVDRSIPNKEKIELLAKLSEKAMQLNATAVAERGFFEAIRLSSKNHGVNALQTLLLQTRWAEKSLQMRAVKDPTALQQHLQAIGQNPLLAQHAELAISYASAQFALANYLGEPTSTLDTFDQLLRVRQNAGSYALRESLADQSTRARLLANANQLAKAESQSRQLIALAQQHQNDASVASLMGYLRADHCDLLSRVNAKDARVKCEAALVQAQDRRGLETADGFYLLQSLGNLYHRDAEPQLALSSFLEALRVLRMIEGPETRSLRAAESMHAIGGEYLQAGNAPIALDYLAKACAIKLSRLGPATESTASCQLYLAQALAQLGRFESARAAIERVAPVLASASPIESGTQAALNALRSTLPPESP